MIISPTRATLCTPPVEVVVLFLSTGTEIQLHCNVRYQKEAMGVISNNQDLILRMDPESGLLTLVQEVMVRVEICRDRHDRRSCKTFANCVNFPGKQRDFLHNMCRISRLTHTKCDFALKLLKLYTLS